MSQHRWGHWLWVLNSNKISRFSLQSLGLISAGWDFRPPVLPVFTHQHNEFPASLSPQFLGSFSPFLACSQIPSQGAHIAWAVFLPCSSGRMMLPLLIPFPARSSPSRVRSSSGEGQELLLGFAAIQRLPSPQFLSLCAQTSCAGVVVPPQPLQEELLGISL